MLALTHLPQGGTFICYLSHMLVQVAAVEYLNYLQYDRNFKDMKHRTYRIGRLVMFWLDKHIEALTFDDITDFKKELIQRQCSLTYINNYLFIVRSLFRFCQARYKITTLHPSDIKPFFINPRPINYLNKEEIRELLHYFSGSTIADYRNRALREMSKKLGRKIHPHLLRRTAINNWKMNGMDIKNISLIAGHESVKTTEKYYLGVDWEWLKKEHARYGFV